MFYIKKFFSLFINNIICVIASLLFISFLPKLSKLSIVQIVYTACAIFIYFEVFYSFAWKLAKSDLKAKKTHTNHIKEDEVSHNVTMKNGIILGAMYLIFNFLIYIFTVGTHGHIGIYTTIYRILFSPYIMFFTNNVKHINLISFVAVFVPSVAIILGYKLGLMDISIYEKFVTNVVYKKNKEK